MSSKKVLIVDDNDTYARNLEKFFEEKNIPTLRAKTGIEGWKFFSSEEFHTVITDVTMETRAAGMILVWKIKNSGYKGQVMIASTAFDQFGVLFFGKYLLPSFGRVGWMIPKVPLRKGIVEFHPTNLQNSQPEF